MRCGALHDDRVPEMRVLTWMESGEEIYTKQHVDTSTMNETDLYAISRPAGDDHVVCTYPPIVVEREGKFAMSYKLHGRHWRSMGD